MKIALPLWCAALVLPASAAEPAGVWLCVGSAEFRQAAAPLIGYRRAEGLNVKEANGPAAAAIAACDPKPDFILLLGDEFCGTAIEGCESWRMAAARRPFHGWQSSHPEEFVSDMALGDFDGDGLPDAPVGRIPARRAAEVAAAAGKIVLWEKRSPVLSDLTLPVWAGDPGFGSFFRDMALGFFFSQIQRRAPLWTEFWFMQGDERSPFCSWPAEQQTCYNARLTGGGLVSAMIGHGRTGGWWSMDLAGQRLEYAVADAALLTEGPPAPPHIIFACATGNFSLQEHDCLTEALFRAPGGPVLCVGATEDSHPLTNYYHSTALLESFGDAAPRFGEQWLRSLRKAHATTEPEKELLVHALEPFMIRKQLRTADIRADHAMLYNIIGDPATRVFAPQKLKADIVEKAGQWRWKVPHPPSGARLLVQRREPLPEFPLTPPAGNREEAIKRMTEANGRLQFHTIAELAPGETWSGKTPGPGTLRLVAVSGQEILVAAVEMKATK